MGAGAAPTGYFYEVDTTFLHWVAFWEVATCRNWYTTHHSIGVIVCICFASSVAYAAYPLFRFHCCRYSRLAKCRNTNHAGPLLLESHYSCLQPETALSALGFRVMDRR